MASKKNQETETVQAEPVRPNPNSVVEALSGESKEARLEQLKWRRENKLEQIDNSKLYAGSPMYYYCISCAWLSSILPENWFLHGPDKLCPECSELKELGWLE